MRKETYPRSPYSQSELGLEDDEWEVLQNYVETIGEALEPEVTSSGGVEEVEEQPPRFRNGGFDPGGWVGLYPGEVTIVPSHLSDEEYQLLLDETQEWVEVIGAKTIAAAFPLSSDILIDARARLAAYSEALIELTETVQAHRLPVEVQRTQHRGFDPEGRPLFEETIRESAQGSQRVVSEETQFTFDTLLNHLLVRFHIELLGEMRELADKYEYYRAAFESQIDYHENFISTGIPNRFVDQAIETDFTAPRVVAEARHAASDEMSEIVNLWEAFQRDIGMELTLSSQLNTAVKPISKLYELWCLRILLEILADITGSTPEADSTIERVYRFNDELTLHYNRSLRTYSQFLRDNLGVNPGAPDFALEVGDSIVWIGDAKFKTNVRISDYRRFITYVVDLLSPEQQSAIFYVEEEPRGRQFVRDYPIDHFSLRPDHRTQARTNIEDNLREVLERANVV